MPLNCQVKRNKRVVKLPEWQTHSEAMLNVFLTIGLKEGDPDLVYNADGKTFGEVEPPKFVNVAWTGVYYINTKCPLWSTGELTLSRDYEYKFDLPEVEAPFNVHLKKGDTLHMWRN